MFEGETIVIQGKGLFSIINKIIWPVFSFSNTAGFSYLSNQKQVFISSEAKFPFHKRAKSIVISAVFLIVIRFSIV